VSAPDLLDTIRLTSVLLGVSLLLGALEQLSIVREYRSDGLYSWKVFRSQFPEFSFPVARPLLSAAFGYTGVCVLQGGAVLSALLLIAPGFPVFACFLAAAAALLIKFALAYRSFYGSDGSDQMETIVLAGLCAALALFPAKWANLGIAFIAAESALSYCASGVSKVFSRSWMSGDAAFRIFNTYTYGNGFTASALRRYPRAARPLCWLIVAYECAFPLCLILPPKIALAILVLGVLFHVLNALVMGLNKFLWAFVATYPALFYCNREIAAWLASR
jgi:hypothetical protein